MMHAHNLWDREHEHEHEHEHSTPPDSGVQRIAALAGVPEPEPFSRPALRRRAQDVPEHEVIDFRCVVCKKASFGEQCPCCGGEVCTDHDDFVYKWCERCESSYRQQRGALEGTLVTVAAASLLGCVPLLALAQLHEDTYLKGFSAAVLLAWAILTVFVVGARILGRWQFRANHAGVRQTYFGSF